MLLQTKTADRKKSLESIAKELAKANSEVKTLQLDIKRCPQEKVAELTSKAICSVSDNILT